MAPDAGGCDWWCRLTAESRSPEQLRVLIVDDHEVVHWGFRLMLAQQPWVQRCLNASDGAEALDLVVRYRPHVAIVDLFIGEESGAEICERLRAAEPATRVLLLSGAGEISRQAAQTAGASGFAHKDWPARKIAAAVRLVGMGGTLFERQEPTTTLKLSKREREVLELIAAGSTNPEIAATLHLSPHTVKEHASSLYRKLDVRNRTEAVQVAQRLGLLS